MQRFITWETLELRIDGERINELVQTMKVPPIERLSLRFSNGLLRVEGVIRKVIAVPFSADITELFAEGTTVRVPIRSASAFGAIPIPQFLFMIVQGRLPKDLVGFEPPATFVVSLDRFLPPFVSADVRTIWIIDGGLQITLGRGGADLPGDLDGK
ncbi:MAG TPA: hypothetical protein VJ276_07690 [Thermoanaerobaculia bacterium]|nr:hypothetical protein [Thermoanaerobaculia bacterium]